MLHAKCTEIYHSTYVSVHIYVELCQSSSESSSKCARLIPELLPLGVVTGEEPVLEVESCDWEQAACDSSIEGGCGPSPSALIDDVLLAGEETSRNAFKSFCHEGVGHIFMVLPPTCFPFFEPPLDALTGVTAEEDEPRAFLGARATTAEGDDKYGHG